MKNIRDWLIACGHAEGISFLALLFIAMPLKYMAGLPLAVTIVGGLHGILFIAFISLLWEARKRMKLSWWTCIKAVGLAITPFGTFFLGRVIPAMAGVRTDK